MFPHGEFAFSKLWTMFKTVLGMQTAKAPISRRTAMSLIAAGAASIIAATQASAANAASSFDERVLVERCIQVASDPARVATTFFDRENATILPCSVDGRWLVTVPGTDRAADLFGGNATLTAVFDVSDSMVALATYRGIDFDDLEIRGLQERSGREVA